MAGKARANKKFEPLCKWKHEEDRDILDIQLQGFKTEQLGIKLSQSRILKIFGERPNASKEAEFHIEITLPSNKYITQAIRAKFECGHLYITMPKINRETNGKISSEPSKIDQTPKQELPKDQSTVVPPTPPSHDHISGVAKEQTPKQELSKDQSTLSPPLAPASEDSTRGGAKEQAPKQELPKNQPTLSPPPPPPPPPPSHGSISGAKAQQKPPSDENTLPEFKFHGHNPLMLGLGVGEMAASLAATVAAIAVLVAYVVYMYKTTFDGF